MTTGFNPTIAAAKAARSGRTARAASVVHASATATPSPARALNATTTAPGERGHTRTIPSLRSVKAGPYGEWVCSHCADVTRTNGSRWNDLRTATYGFRWWIVETRAY